mmetsp:Transcript_139897/g.447444  ORF Transcript_139897/g.447444 Transcript_139897/m.447444 type:complete len:265 (-) Transcript_139897:52-846(-)
MPGCCRGCQFRACCRRGRRGERRGELGGLLDGPNTLARSAGAAFAGAGLLHGAVVWHLRGGYLLHDVCRHGACDRRQQRSSEGERGCEGNERGACVLGLGRSWCCRFVRSVSSLRWLWCDQTFGEDVLPDAARGGAEAPHATLTGGPDERRGPREKQLLCAVLGLATSRHREGQDSPLCGVLALREGFRPPLRRVRPLHCAREHALLRAAHRDAPRGLRDGLRLHHRGGDVHPPRLNPVVDRHGRGRPNEDPCRHWFGRSHNGV